MTRIGHHYVIDIGIAYAIAAAYLAVNALACLFYVRAAARITWALTRRPTTVLPSTEC